MSVTELSNTVRVKLREETNPFFSKFRREKLKNKNVTIISNNCWGGHVYRYLGISYLSPTVGLYFYADDYVKFCRELKYYMGQELKFISIKESRHSEDLIAGNKHCPIGILDDVEIIFSHYKTEVEACEKWNRRKNRIVWDNIVFKFSEQNLCLPEHIREFDLLPYIRKLVFVTSDYSAKSQVLWGGDCVKGNIPNDTILFREFVDPIKFINGEPFKKRQKQVAKKLKIHI